MGKLGIIFDQQKEAVKGIIKRYLVTIICVNIACVLDIVLRAADLYNKGNVVDITDYIFGFLMMFAVGSFFVESFFTEDGSNRKKLLLPYIIFGLISLALDILGNNRSWFSEMGEDMFRKTTVLYVIICTVLGFHKLIKNSGMSFEKYIVNLVVGVIKVGVVLFILNIGFVLLVTIFDILIVDIDAWEFIGYVEEFLIGAVYLPYSLVCVTDKAETKSRFIRGLLLWVLMPMVNAAMIIIYMYVLKILVTGYMPKNEVFYICAYLFCCGVVIWTMAYPFAMDSYKDSKAGTIYRNVIKYAKYIYAPFILLECYSMGIRIHECGVTLVRYFAVVFIICQVIYIAWEPLYGLVRKIGKKEKNNYAEGYEHLLYVGIAVYVLCVMLPLFSGERIEFLSQKKRFEAMMDGRSVEELNLSAADVKSLRSTYLVLGWNIYGEEYLEETYTQAERAALKKQLDVDYYREQWAYKHKVTQAAISVDGYRYMQSFSEKGYMGYNDDEIYIGENAVIPMSINIKELDNTEDIVCDVDVRELVALVISKDENSNGNDGTLPYDILMDDGRKCVVTEISFDYDSLNNMIKNLQLRGYILW